jgi:predicted Zn-dependent protease
VLVFGALMLALSALALAAVLLQAARWVGLPDDPDALAAQQTLAGAPLYSGELRFRSALTGEALPGWGPAAGEAWRFARAESLLRAGRARHPGDPRFETAIGHLELARRRFDRAADRYEGALAPGSECAEARLGYGLALASRAEAMASPLERRRLTLRAIAQFRAVPPEDPVGLEAAYDLAWTLARAGREGEAEAAAAAYFLRDPDGPWALQLRGHLSREARKR